MKRLSVIFGLLWCLCGAAEDVIPPAPARHFNDYAQVVLPATAARLDSLLLDHERQSSDQILVTVFPKMQSDAPIKDYTLRVANSWKVGQKGKNNGAVLFVFIQDHKVYLQVGTGLEGVLPDALCQRIIDAKITPQFKKGDFDGGLTAGVTAIIAATKGSDPKAGPKPGESPAATTNSVAKPVGKPYLPHE